MKKKKESAKHRPKVSEITRQKLKEAATGRKLSEETKNKIGNSNRNPSEETRRKMSESGKKKPKPSEETRYKYGNGFRGKLKICNINLNCEKFILKNELENYIKLGWIRFGLKRNLKKLVKRRKTKK